ADLEGVGAAATNHGRVGTGRAEEVRIAAVLAAIERIVTRTGPQRVGTRSRRLQRVIARALAGIEIVVAGAGDQIIISRARSIEAVRTAAADQGMIAAGVVAEDVEAAGDVAVAARDQLAAAGTSQGAERILASSAMQRVVARSSSIERV